MKPLEQASEGLAMGAILKIGLAGLVVFALSVAISFALTALTQHVGPPARLSALRTDSTLFDDKPARTVSAPAGAFDAILAGARPRGAGASAWPNGEAR